MRDFITLGPTPYEEPCACVGEEEYYERARQECQRFITLLRKVFGPEPPDTRLTITSFPHDFGDYLEVVCYYDPDNQESMDYAFQCEENIPATWEGRTPHNRKERAL